MSHTGRKRGSLSKFLGKTFIRPSFNRLQCPWDGQDTLTGQGQVTVSAGGMIPLELQTENKRRVVPPKEGSVCPPRRQRSGAGPAGTTAMRSVLHGWQTRKAPHPSGTLKMVPKKTQRSPPTAESTRGSPCEDEGSPSLSNYRND